MSIKTDPNATAAELLASLYAGDLLVMTQLKAVGQLVDLTRRRLEELFTPYQPEQAHEHFAPEVVAGMLGSWKPAFIHSKETNDLVRDIIVEAGFDASDTHYDAPKPRTSFPQGHLTTGIAFAFPWHRDTWYAAPSQQINWWLPIYPVTDKNAMSFDTSKFASAVPNTSGDFDYYQANADRLTASTQIKTDNRARPKAVGHYADTDTIILPAPGSVLLFSGANLHTSIPNTSGVSRYSIDFRTVNAPDVLANNGAPVTDVHCSGTAIRDFVNLATSDRFPEEMVVQLYGHPPEGGFLVFDDNAARQAASTATAG